MDDREAAWDAVHKALPAGWGVSHGEPDAEGDVWYVVASGPRPGPGKAIPSLYGSGADETTALRDLERKLRRGPPPGGVYTGPGIETALVVVPVVTGIAAVAGIVVALTATASDGIRVGLAALVAGMVGWIALWETFVRLHPRFAEGTGERIKWWLVVGGPPVLALGAAAVAR